MSATPEQAADHHALVQARVGPLHERLAPLASAWRDSNGYRVCTRMRDEQHGADDGADGPWLRCLTHQPRIGFKGRGSSAWLESSGVALPAVPNRWCRDAGGALVARLGAQDFLIFDEGDSPKSLPEHLAERWRAQRPPGCFVVPRQHGLVSIALEGRQAAAVLARLCAVDLAPGSFADDAIAQTQVALMSAVVMRVTHGEAAGYRLFVDTSLARYCWDMLNDVVLALGGGVRVAP